jgi:hypothetical protein
MRGVGFRIGEVPLLVSLEPENPATATLRLSQHGRVGLWDHDDRLDDHPAVTIANPPRLGLAWDRGLV